MYRSVVCNDVTGITDPQAWNAAITRTAAQSPVAFYELQTNLCPYWGGPRVAHPGIAPLKTMPLLTVQSQYDAATITENAATLLRPTGRRLAHCRARRVPARPVPLPGALP